MTLCKPPYERTLYPEIEPYNTGTLQVSDTHHLYFEECGNPHGKPVVYLHGGPGAGCGRKTVRKMSGQPTRDESA